MKKNFSFMYDELSDELMISQKEESDVVEGSVRFLNLVIDITRENKISNITLFGASHYLESLELNPKILTKLIGAKFVVKNMASGYLIYIILKLRNKVERVPYKIFVRNPIAVSQV